MMEIKRTRLPENIAVVMKSWRDHNSWDAVPQCYVDFHLALARAECKRLMVDHGIRILSEDVVDGGWLDGMRELRVGIETKLGQLLWLQWHDGNQCFMKHSVGCGGMVLLGARDLD